MRAYDVTAASTILNRAAGSIPPHRIYVHWLNMHYIERCFECTVGLQILILKRPRPRERQKTYEAGCLVREFRRLLSSADLSNAEQFSSYLTESTIRLHDNH
jgi:hypothetical protein